MKPVKYMYLEIPISFLLNVPKEKDKTFLASLTKGLYPDLISHKILTTLPHLEIEFYVDRSKKAVRGNVKHKDIVKNIFRIYVNFAYLDDIFHDWLRARGETEVSETTKVAYHTFMREELSKVISHELAHLHHSRFQDIRLYGELLLEKVNKSVDKVQEEFQACGKMPESTAMDFLAIIRSALGSLYKNIYVEGYAKVSDSLMDCSIDSSHKCLQRTCVDALKGAMQIEILYADTIKTFKEALAERDFLGNHYETLKKDSDLLLELCKDYGYLIGLHVYHVISVEHSYIELVKLSPKKILDLYLKMAKERGLQPVFSYTDKSSILSYRGMLKQLFDLYEEIKKSAAKD